MVYRVTPEGIRLIPAHAGKTTSSLAYASVMSAHPRSRGENLMNRTIRPFVAGSSPLTRGKPRLGEPALPHPRLIPAHAGKTGQLADRVEESGAHPRSRGENLIVDRPANPQAGSSPLTRGKQHR